MAIDLDGNQLTQGQPLHREMPIHTEIYRRRPDVNCVVHTHPLYTSALAATEGRLLMVGQDSLLFADGIGFHDSPEFVVTRALGEQVAEALGHRRAVLLRNHGVAVAGDSVAHATYLTLSLERAVRSQVAALQLGAVREMSTDEVRSITGYLDTSYHDALPNTWGYLLRQSGLASR
jgi:L-fuculose-phosphate aldolase